MFSCRNGAGSTWAALFFSAESSFLFLLNQNSGKRTTNQDIIYIKYNGITLYNPILAFIPTYPLK
jgi:hypothetical protein